VRLGGGGLHGWGESTPLPLPTYSPEWGAGVYLVVRDVLAPAVLGQPIASGSDLQQRLAFIKGNPFAKGALDNAWWDLLAKSRGRPLWQVLGGRGDTIEVGEAIGVMDSLDRLLEAIDAAFRAGYLRVKLKYCTGWGLEMIRAVRGAFPDQTFHIDCNSGFRLDDLAMFQELDRYGLAMIEQPLAHDDLVDHAELQRQIRTPICLDESITSPRIARQAVRIGACRWVNIKPARVGGVTNAVAIHDICRDAGVPCWIGGMLESALGVSFLMALATLENIRYPCDVFPSRRFYARDLCRPEVALSGPSRITLSAEPGVGAEPDPEQLGRLTIDSAVLRA